jgi:Pyridine nucleotide-disulphide oxidoreductase, dimerisation domain
MNYNRQHRFYVGVDLHARTLFVHVLDHKGKTVFEQELPAEPAAFLRAIKPYRKDLVVGCECMFAWYWLADLRPMTRVARAVEKGETQGFMKIAVDAENGAILGAAILGTSGDEVIHSILDVMYAKAPWTVIRRAMHIHPTVSELVPTMLSELRPMDS